VQEAGDYHITQLLATLNILPTVQGVLLTRIDRLHEDLKYVLQVASTVGRVFILRAGQDETFEHLW